MKLTILTFVLIFVFQGCSFKTPENQWEYNSASSFKSYTKNFLSDNQELANDDLQRAVKYAKQSANLEQLSRIYLGVCALNIAIGENDNCKEYIEIEELTNSKQLKAYFLMLQNKIDEEQIKNLPKQYQEFSEYKFLEKHDLSFESIKSMEQSSSQFIAASLIQKDITKSQIEFLIKRASFYGYKKIVLYWLDKLYNIENNPQKKEKIAKKIKILRS